MRLRTLPLSLAGVVLGLLLALRQHTATPSLIVWLLLTTVCLQILSNLSNELGDYLQGTDGSQREGPQYSLAQGALDVNDFKRLIAIFAGLCCLFGAAMVWTSFGTFLDWQPALLLLLGAAAIWAAMHYTLGKNPYGYRGLGDVSVFIFFGLVSVMGAYFVVAHTLDSPLLLLPAAAIGCFSVGVLNVNNIRDMESDAEHRVTIPLKIGSRKAKIYQTTLIVTAWICMLAFTLSSYTSGWNFLYLATLPPYALHLNMVWKRDGKNLDPALPLLVLTTFVFSLLAGIGYLM
jgi:1,4-dihydroxy-2-naphthoate octaprenyltransferase